MKDYAQKDNKTYFSDNKFQKSNLLTIEFEDILFFEEKSHKFQSYEVCWIKIKRNFKMFFMI